MLGIVTSDVSSRKTVLDSYEQPAAAASDPQLVVNSPQLAAAARMNSRAKMAGREQRGEGEARRQAPAVQGGNAKEKCRNQPPFIRNCAHVTTVKYEQLCRERTRERTKVLDQHVAFQYQEARHRSYIRNSDSSELATWKGSSVGQGLFRL